MGLMGKLKSAFEDHAGELGEMPVPGEEKFTFPAGKLVLTLRVAESNNETLHVPKQMECTITPVGESAALEHKGSQQGSRARSNALEPFSQRGFGYVDIPADGEYVVKAGGLEGAPSRTGFKYLQPKILLGP